MNYPLLFTSILFGASLSLPAFAESCSKPKANAKSPEEKCKEINGTKFDQEKNLCCPSDDAKGKKEEGGGGAPPGGAPPPQQNDKPKKPKEPPKEKDAPEPPKKEQFVPPTDSSGFVPQNGIGTLPVVPDKPNN